MPRYDYKCSDCGTEAQQTHSMFDLPDPSPCCDAPVKKIFHPTPVAFKGDGWGGKHPRP